MSGILIWYLIITNTYTGGVVALPEPNRAQCVEQIESFRRFNPNNSMFVMFCIQGVK